MKRATGLVPRKFARWLVSARLRPHWRWRRTWRFQQRRRPTISAQPSPARPSSMWADGRHHYRHRHYRPRHWRYRHHRRYRPYRRSGVYFGYGGNGAAAMFGLATGAILGQALGGPQYIDPPVRRVYRGRYAPWTPAWYSYCARKYRSFNPETGYFLAYSGRYRFCR